MARKSIPDDFLFSHSEVRDITGAKTEWLQNWGRPERGLITATEHQVGTGHQRKYDLENLVEIAILVNCTMRGIGPKIAKLILERARERASDIRVGYLINIKAKIDPAIAFSKKRRYWIIDTVGIDQGILDEIEIREVRSDERGKVSMTLKEVFPLAFILAIDDLIHAVMQQALKMRNEALEKLARGGQ